MAKNTKVLSIILGGGKGTRLYPLTKERSKPAVPFGGKHRIVDIPISNCINSGFKQVYILTQFNSASLHMHISHAYSFDSFSGGFVEILAAEQTFEHSGWFEGTADAVRKNFAHFRTQKPTHYIILSGDQLYQMDLRDFLDKHLESGAEISIATTAVTREDATGFGIMKVNKKNEITAFMEKPAADLDISDWIIPDESRTPGATKGKDYLASMGIYIFNADTLYKVLDNDATDFGKEIIPAAIKNHKVQSYIYDGYWEDIGTIKSFYEANLDLTRITPKFNFYDEDKPIFTHSRNLPSSKMNNANLNNAIASEGCVITEATINNSLVGLRSIVESGTYLDGVICMGADFYETMEEKAENAKLGRPNVGIGKNCRIKKCIIDKNARIGDNCSIGHTGKKLENGDHGMFYVADDIIIIPKNTIIPEGTII
ncbi:MAG: glucose-1-phosphate adenylyltransferase [Spirochaetaceae bacterium]|nr:glucose-1-phosphate adenylyltransferase [Spirochaetaceae bacterium]MDD6486115.1 glucose-1-phosphate adenylyltransferase [Spirochaetales bacterium]